MKEALHSRKEHILYDYIYVMFQNKENEPMVEKMRTMAVQGEELTGKRYEGIWSDSNSLCLARCLGHTCMYFPKLKEYTHEVYKFHCV